MKILLVNSNENKDITKKMMETAGKAAASSTQIEGINAKSGVPVVKTPEDIVRAAQATCDVILANEEKYDAFLLACFSEPGLSQASDKCKKPIFGMAGSSFQAACQKGQYFAVMSGERRMQHVLEEQIKEYGLWNRCSGVLTVDAGYVETFLDKDAKYPLYLKAAKEYIKEQRTDVLCLGGAVFTDWKELLEKDLGIPVIEGIEAAVNLAQTAV